MGIALDPQHWTDNAKIIELVYNVAKNQIAFIEVCRPSTPAFHKRCRNLMLTPVQDFYDITTSLPLGSGTAAYIDAKFDAVTAHLTNATQTDLNPDQLYISFASAAFIDDNPVVTPQVRLSTKF